ncbi:MAG: hypothetical protein ACYCZY_13075 [Lacisediminihabitans sp.]
MLQLAIIPTVPEPAYAVPLRVDRSDAPRFRIVNVGNESLRGVRLTLLGAGVMPAGIPSTLPPGKALEFTLRGENLALSTIVIVRWFRPTGEEYLWRVSF